MDQYWPYVFFMLGVVGRIVIPYLIRRAETGEPFDWRYVKVQLLGAVVALIPLVAAGDKLAEIGRMAWIAALAYGWFALDVAREAQKAGHAAAVNRGRREMGRD
jgi:hypothetical protein